MHSGDETAGNCLIGAPCPRVGINNPRAAPEALASRTHPLEITRPGTPFDQNRPRDPQEYDFSCQRVVVAQEALEARHLVVQRAGNGVGLLSGPVQA